MLQIQARTRERRGKARTNFGNTLRAQVFEDPYLFDSLGTADLRREREVEQALVDHIQRFLLELGTGFAFVDRQVPLDVGDVAGWETKLVEKLPKALKGSLPTVEEIEAELSGDSSSTPRGRGRKA